MDLFAACPPGLEPPLAEEMSEAGFAEVAVAPGGVGFAGDWPEVWRANLCLRIPTRILARIAGFPAVHLAQLDKRARKVDWAAILRPDVPVRVEASCRRSKIYHAGAAGQRIGRAIAETVGARVVDTAAEATEAIRVMARIEANMVTISIDTSGAPLHRRGTKLAVGKAPIRETMAAAFLRQAGFDGRMPVVDPMCGSGTFVIEAAARAAGLAPGAWRDFAFERLAGFDAGRWGAMRPAPPDPGPATFFGADRDDGAIRGATENAARAGLGDRCRFTRAAISDAAPPDGPPGLVAVNPPYGGRIGKTGPLYALYGTLGEVLRARFGGWRVALVTSEPALARATGLPFDPPGPPIPHGPLKVRLYTAGPL